jgi:hypothetical protein
MNELASESSNMSGQSGRVSMPGRLKGALIVLVFQVLANGFLGYVLVQSLNDEASHGETADGAGLGYALGYISIAVAVVLLACVVFSFRPQPWVRPVVITIETIAILSDLVSLVNGAVSVLLGIVLAIAVTTIMTNDDVRGWYRHGRY